MQFIDAERRKTRILCSLGSESGGGKTYGGLLLAQGLVEPGEIVVGLDTENERMCMYADDPEIGKFKVGFLYPPFSAETYIKALDEAEKLKPGCIVLDSGSHEWSGIGGVREQADAIEALFNKRGKKAGPLAWAKPKMSHARFVNRLNQCQCHVIICLRAGKKLLPVKTDEGQGFVESPDLVAEQEKRFIFEMTLSALIDHKTHQARWVKRPKPLINVLPDGQMLSRDTGRLIREWVATGKAIDVVLERQLIICRDLASAGLAPLQRHWNELDRDMRLKLQPHMQSFKDIAAEADRISAQGDEIGNGAGGEPSRDVNEDPFSTAGEASVNGSGGPPAATPAAADASLDL